MAIVRVVEPAFMTPVEVAALLQTSLHWVYEKTRSRNQDPLPCMQLGRYLRFDKQAVLEWARQRNEPCKAKTLNDNGNQLGTAGAEVCHHTKSGYANTPAAVSAQTETGSRCPPKGFL